MASTPASAPREREDTKTLVRLGGDRESAPSDSAAAPVSQHDVLRDIAQEGDATGNRVQLWFKGLEAPVRARVRISGERIRLETLLPFLELDSEVAIARTEDGARLHARIAQVSLATSAEQPVPRLSVEVAIAPDEAKGQPVAGAVDAVSPSAEAAADATVPTSAPRTWSASEPASGTQGSRVLPWIAAFVLGAVGGAAGTGAWLAPWLRAPFAAPAHRHDVEHASLDGARASEPAAVAEAVAAPVAAVPVPVPVQVPSPAPEPLLPEADELAAAPAAADPEAAAVAEAAPEASPERSAAPSEPAAEPAPARGLEIESANGRTEIFIPMQGSGEGMQRYALTTPGVSFTLPHAQATIAVSNYLIEHRPLVRRVWLREHEGGVQVRIILPRESIQDEARFDADGLHIVLRP
jgi:hypothetical protein